MNDAVKMWVSALRSGKYKQTTEALRTSEGFCCLGVACDIYKDINPQWSWKEDRNDSFVFVNGYEMNAGSLPQEVQEWLGLRADDGFFVSDTGVHTSLAEANDNGMPFDKIADIIEGEPVDLFGVDDEDFELD